MSSIGATAAAVRESARRSSGRFGEPRHADPGQVGLHQPAEEPAPVTAVRVGERVRVRWAGGEWFDATMLGRCAAPGRRFVIDSDGDTFEVGIRDGAVTAGPDELARRARVARLAQERGVVAVASWPSGGARWVHAADCPHRLAGGRPLRLNDAVEAYRQAVEHDEAIGECLRSDSPRTIGPMGVGPQEDVPKAARPRWPGWLRSAWHRIWWWAGWALLAPLALVLFRAPPQWPALLIGPVIVTVWRVVVAMYVVGVTCWILSLVALRPDRWLRSPSAALRSTGSTTLRRVVLGLVTAATLLCATGTAVISGFNATADRYYVLSPASAGGCRVVSKVNTGGIKGVSSDVLLAVPGSPVLRNTGAGWSTRDQVDPFRTGDWSLSWSGPSALLTVWVGDPSNRAFDPHSQPSASITCPR